MDAVTPKNNPALAADETPVIDFRIALVAELTASQMSAAECLSRDLDDEQIGKALGIRKPDAAGLVGDVYRVLRFDATVQLHARRKYAGKLYKEYHSARAADKPVDPTVQKDARARINRCGVNIDLVHTNVSTLNETQMQALAHIGCGADDDALVTGLNRSKQSVEAMVRVMMMHFCIPSDLQPAKQRLYLAGIGLWAAEQYTHAADRFEALYGKPDEADPPDKGGDDKAKDELLLEPEMEALVDKLAKAPDRMRKVARCMAGNLDIATSLSIRPANVSGYKSSLYGALGLDKSIGRERRDQIVAEVHRRLEARPIVVASPATAPQQEHTEVADSDHVTVINSGTLVPDDDTVDGVFDELAVGDSSDRIAHWRSQGYSYRGYVMMPNGDRFIVFVRKRKEE